jgi:hypothetical protein
VPVYVNSDSKYYEPDHWKFGTEGNNYFRHATRQLYAVTRDLATYISANRWVVIMVCNTIYQISCLFNSFFFVRHHLSGISCTSIQMKMYHLALGWLGWKSSMLMREAFAVVLPQVGACIFTLNFFHASWVFTPAASS